ncbi:hypothetical protein GCM10023168_02100 [Fodinibacter luteus]|uniref:Uncharacterized protein n=1 Tax=Fodinibacter luteus TaxID=552064 RepID=A0ABP8JX28_9MICO
MTTSDTTSGGAREQGPTTPGGGVRRRLAGLPVRELIEELATTERVILGRSAGTPVSEVLRYQALIVRELRRRHRRLRGGTL